VNRVLHDFCVDTMAFRLCSKCAQPDIGAVRMSDCEPLPEAEAKQQIRQTLLWTRRLLIGSLARVPGRS
jgi:hypothetical protein